MVTHHPYQNVDEAISPLHHLVSVSAGNMTSWLRLLFALDARCARICRTSSEVMTGQLRLAWLRDALANPIGAIRPEIGEPLIDSLRDHPTFEHCQASLGQIVDGWEELLVGTADRAGEDLAMMLSAYAKGRGAGLFRAISVSMGTASDDAQSGSIWALWDLAGHISDAALANAALAMAAQIEREHAYASISRPIAILSKLSRADVRQGRGAPPGMTVGLYLRVLRMQILGR